MQRQWKALKEPEQQNAAEDAEDAKEFNFGNLIHPGAIFGELGIVSHQKWQGGSVIALDPSTIIVFAVSYIDQLLKVDLI